MCWSGFREQSIISNSNIKDKEKHQISHQTRADICSFLIGFEEMCTEKLKNGSSSIVPNRINSDVIENVFCQQRGLYNGNNTNPTYLNYCRTMTTVILRQNTISKKSNVGGSISGAEPYRIHQYSSSVPSKSAPRIWGKSFLWCRLMLTVCLSNNNYIYRVHASNNVGYSQIPNNNNDPIFDVYV